MPHKNTYLKILEHLAEEPKTYSQLKKALNISDHVLSYNLKKLRDQEQAIEKEKNAYRISPLGIILLNTQEFARTKRAGLHRITKGISIPLLQQIGYAPIDVFLVANSGVDLKTALQNLASDINVLVPRLVNDLCDEVARQKGFQNQFPLDFKPSILVTKNKYDFDATIVVHYHGHKCLENVNWEALAKKAETLDNQVKTGLEIIKQNLQNEQFRERLKKSFVERFGQKSGEEIFNTLVEDLQKEVEAMPTG